MKRQVTVTGTVTSISYPGTTRQPHVAVRVHAPNGDWTAMFLGRRSIRCLAVGDHVVMRGAPVCWRGERVIVCPSYRVQPLVEVS
ncbi:hypothetical protein [Neoactinobaculum massilliense]|uniref:hypothetical protein n=1 Tax=Neoactinobaculum massilliense TaxID=2364794 RepID=UPI000F525EEB|nr:hypothetical protein [Neoactinobaculum massilliense]